MIDELYFKDAFSKTGDDINLTVNNASVTCLSSNNNKFSLDSNGNLTVATITATDQDNIEIDYSAILNMVYPVGSIYISVNEVNPNTLFGGAWEAIEDRFLLACGDSYAALSSGGEANVTLTTANLPSHSHTGSTNNAGNHVHDLYYRTVYSDGGDFNAVCRPTAGTAISNYMDSAGNHKHTFTTSSVGSGTAHNNMPPYLAVYMWKRIS